MAGKVGIEFSAYLARCFFARYPYSHGIELERVRILMRHAVFETMKEHIQMGVKDALNGVRRIDLDFGPGKCERKRL
ncbi:MAG: hypothetical protein ACP5UV_03345 [Thermoplasmata archaeon]